MIGTIEKTAYVIETPSVLRRPALSLRHSVCRNKVLSGDQEATAREKSRHLAVPVPPGMYARSNRARGKKVGWYMDEM